MQAVPWAGQDRHRTTERASAGLQRKTREYLSRVTVMSFFVSDLYQEVG